MSSGAPVMCKLEELGAHTENYEDTVSRISDFIRKRGCLSPVRKNKSTVSFCSKSDIQNGQKYKIFVKTKR